MPNIPVHPAHMPGVSASSSLQQKNPLPIVADLHAHTAYSHGQASTMEMVAAAQKAGLLIFGFSEHSPRPAEYPYPRDYQEKLRKSLPIYVAEVQGIATQTAELGMQVLLGIEVDYFPDREDFARELIQAYPFDYVIGGLHFQGTWGFDFTASDWAYLGQEECFAIYARYYEDLEAMCRSGLFHIAAHPDLIKLFSKDTFDAWLATPQAEPYIRKALIAMRENNVLMEVSSAGLRKPCSEIYPGPKIMALAQELGVRISFGSDAHCTNTPAFGFAELARHAAAFGYTESFIVISGKQSPLPFTPAAIL